MTHRYRAWDFIARNDPPRAGGPTRERLNSQFAVLGFPALGSKEKRYSRPNQVFEGRRPGWRRRVAIFGIDDMDAIVSIRPISRAR
jgi:hypothetical protein